MSIKRAAAFLVMAVAGLATAPASADTGVGPGGDVMGT
jgi:hypothetical protein